MQNEYKWLTAYLYVSGALMTIAMIGDLLEGNDDVIRLAVFGGMFWPVLAPFVVVLGLI